MMASVVVNEIATNNIKRPSDHLLSNIMPPVLPSNSTLRPIKPSSDNDPGNNQSMVRNMIDKNAANDEDNNPKNPSNHTLPNIETSRVAQELRPSPGLDRVSTSSSSMYFIPFSQETASAMEMRRAIPELGFLPSSQETAPDIDATAVQDDNGKTRTRFKAYAVMYGLIVLASVRSPWDVIIILSMSV